MNDIAQHPAVIETPLTRLISQPYILNQNEFFQAIVDNRKRAAVCSQHDFSIEFSNQHFAHSYQFQCASCGFICNQDYKAIYELGYQQAQSKEDIINE